MGFITTTYFINKINYIQLVESFPLKLGIMLSIFQEGVHKAHIYKFFQSSEWINFKKSLNLIVYKIFIV